ncbi:hypothetical protein VIRA109638_14685 [Vibrio rarus]
MGTFSVSAHHELNMRALQHNQHDVNKHKNNQCHLETIRDLGDIVFGAHFDGSASQVKLNVDKHRRRVFLRLKRIEMMSGTNEVANHWLQIQVDGDERFTGDIDYWQRGVELSPQAFTQDGYLEVRLRVNMAKSRAPAGRYEATLTWVLYCE